LSVTGVLWMSVPDEAFTVTVYVPIGVPNPVELPGLPAQATSTVRGTAKTHMAKATRHAMLRVRRSESTSIPPKHRPNTANIRVTVPGVAIGGGPGVMPRIVVLNVNWLVAAWVPSRVTADDALQLAPRGRPEQLSETICVEPFTGVIVTATMPELPAARVSDDGLTVTVKSGVALTVCEIAGEVLALKVELPPYWAVIVCDPWVSAVVENVARPALTMLVPRAAAPSRNVTVPVMVPRVEDVTVAVNVTFAPVVDGFNDEVTTVDVVAVPAALIVWVKAGEVLEAKFESPEYCAVMLCEPCESVAVENDAAPEATATGAPSCVAPSKNVTVPVIVPAMLEWIDAVKVTLCPDVAGFSDEVTCVVVAALLGVLTICKIPEEVSGA
jgi:hypothetical protein